VASVVVFLLEMLWGLLLYLNHGWTRVSMSAEKIFWVKVLLFSLIVGRCFGFGMVFLALFAFVLWCASAWFVVRFNIVCGAHLFR